LSRQLQLAAGTNARFAVIVYQPDARDGAATVRDLRTSEQSDPMAAHDAIDYVIAKMRTQDA
jgi:histidyl-tRNA synthetase